MFQMTKVANFQLDDQSSQFSVIKSLGSLHHLSHKSVTQGAWEEWLGHHSRGRIWEVRAVRRRAEPWVGPVAAGDSSSSKAHLVGCGGYRGPLQYGLSVLGLTEVFLLTFPNKFYLFVTHTAYL